MLNYFLLRFMAEANQLYYISVFQCHKICNLSFKCFASRHW